MWVILELYRFFSEPVVFLFVHFELPPSVPLGANPMVKLGATPRVRPVFVDDDRISSFPDSRVRFGFMSELREFFCWGSTSTLT